MSEEKTFGQIAFEATKSWMAWDHQNTNRELWEVTAQAVIAEYQRRNGEPVAWINHNVLIGIDHYNKLPVQSLQPGVYKHTALFAAPQPLPTTEPEEVELFSHLVSLCERDYRRFPGESDYDFIQGCLIGTNIKREK